MSTLTLRISDAERDGLPYIQTLEQAEARFLAQGCLVLGNAFRRDFIAALYEAYLAGSGSWDETRLIAQSLMVGEGRVMTPLPLRGPFLDPRFFANPVIGALLSRLLSERLVLSSCNLVTALPGSAAQRLHRDDALPFGLSPASVMIPPIAITLAIPLIDLDESTGTTALCPGSHHIPQAVNELGIEPVLGYPQRGDAYLIDYRLAHGGTPNRSAQRRPVAYLVYAQPWYFETINQLDQGMAAVIIDDEAYASLRPGYQQLLVRSRLQHAATRPFEG